MSKKTEKRNHYVYRLDDPITGEFYIGSRTCKCNIEDDRYMGSYCTWKPEDKSRLVKTVLKSNFRNRETTIQYESNLIKENIDNKLNRNYNIPTSGFYTKYGLPHTDEAKQKMSKARTGLYLGMSYEERHGVELANELKEKRRIHLTENNPSRLKHVKEQLIERNTKNNPMNSIEARKKVSEVNKGRIPWNKGIKWKTKKNR